MTATEQLKAKTAQRLAYIGQQVREANPDNHSAMLVSIIGALKAEAMWNPVDVSGVLGAIETALEGFKNEHAA